MAQGQGRRSERVAFNDHEVLAVIDELRAAMGYGATPPFSTSTLLETLFIEIDVVGRKMEQHACIEVYPRPLPDGVRAVIAYNEGDHASTQRFSIAHELAHWIFDFERGEKTPSVSCAPTGGKRAPVERRADYFAAELLCPLWILDQHVDFDIFPPTENEDAIARRDQKIQRLASRFNVSMKCMRNRVNSLYHWRKILR